MAQDALNATPTELYELSHAELYLTARLRAEYYNIIYDN
jgi:hypothetical protein